MKTKATTGMILTLFLVSMLSINIAQTQTRVIATIDINPDTLNLKSNGEYITAYIELPNGYNVEDIDCTSIRLGKKVNSGNLLTNGGFEDGLNGWTPTASGIGSHSTAVVYNGTEHPDALEYKRWNSGSDGGSAGAYQYVDILVSDYNSLYVELDVKVISNSLTDSGWWSDRYGGFGEFPAKIYVSYEDADGNPWLWDHNFHPSDNNERWKRTNFNYVTRNQWFHYVSPNLVEVTTTKTEPHNVPIPSPTPYRITRIWIGGTGWNFHGRMDNINLWGMKFTDGITPASCDWPLESVVGDYDDDGIPDMMVKFNRADVKSLVNTVDVDGDTGDNRQVTLTIIGTVAGQPFEGSDTIRVIKPGK